MRKVKPNRSYHYFICYWLKKLFLLRIGDVILSMWRLSLYAFGFDMMRTDHLSVR